MRTAICVGCSELFETNHSHKKYCSSPCQIKSSRTSEWEKKKSNPINRCQQLLSGAKNRSRDKGVAIDIDLDYLVDLWYKQSECCAVSGIKFNLDFPEKSGEPRFDSPSLDRIVPELGYTKGNIRFVIYQINMAIGPYGLQRLLDTIKAMEASADGHK